ncbi:MAG: hypothetical protein PWR03_1211 [Tenuifilum sp.]|uniref:Wzz/FepE/Etk N-terminal domain-containing protein n=1 Tax=Tenuifilum sp. TaxID=2760880 RepID=UPI0024AA0BB9|nr:Wzz/FepE/Etk N-terminal domain-containing protein [Tenuifilum sp.]MDI3527028.1 hypothetical protein [Tenuifilum sp.]
MSNSDVNLETSMQSIMKTIWNGRRVLFVVGVLAFVLSLIASLLIKPQFKSVATIFPPVSNQVSKELTTVNIQEGLTTFGETQEMEQFLQVLNSRSLKDLVINKLNLHEHWDIDTNQESVKFKTYNKFDSYIKIKPTRYQSINVEVMDTDPAFAALIANTVVDFSDSLMRSIKAQVAQNALMVLDEQYQIMESEMKMLEDSLAVVVSNGVIDPEYQSKVFYKNFISALYSNDRNKLKILNNELKRFGNGTSKHVRYSAEIINLAEHLNLLRQNILVARIEASQKIPTQFIIDRADVPDKKAYPKRLLIVATSTLSALLFAIFFMLLAEYIKKLKNLG